MRGADTKQASMLCLLSPEDRVPKDHPLRSIKELADDALAAMSPLFDEMYSAVGRPSVPPERLIKSSLLIALYTIRSERQFCEQLDYNMLFRWFLDMSMVEPSFDATVFTKNRARLIEHDVGRQVLGAVVTQARAAGLISSEHFTVDGTLIEAWASLKSFRKKDEKPEDRPPPDDPGNPSVDFHNEKRSNATHQSTTDPESRLAKKSKGTAAKLSYSQHALMENRNGLLVDLRIAEANGTAEREVALDMLGGLPGEHRVTVGGDKGYDTKDFVVGCYFRNATPHVAQNITDRRGSAIDGRTTRHPGYAVSQRIRKRVEEIFGWEKTVGGFRRTRYRGEARTQLASYLIGAAYNLLRMAKLLAQPA
jgi:transposase